MTGINTRLYKKLQIAILTKIENRNKGTEFPTNYLERVQKNHPKAMNLQCIPEDPTL